MMTLTDIHIAADHPAFAGHFPDMPIVPGVVLLDETLHAIARLTGESMDGCRLGSVKFKGIVRPGQSLTLRFERTPANSIRFEIESLGRTVADGTLTLAPAALAVDD
jgi:3-hydroxyacyl-[acyl-carrier-protein] dehydratase